MSGTMKIVKVVLPCQMTTEEFALKSQELLDWANDQARRETAIKFLKDQHKAPIKLAKDKQLEIRETLNTKTVAREVECFQVYNWDTSMTHQVRKDTGEMVPGSVRKMTKDEMQMDHTQEVAPEKYLLLQNLTEAEVVETKEPLSLPAPAETSELQKVAEDGEITTVEAADIAGNEKSDSDFEVVDDIDQPEQPAKAVDDIGLFSEPEEDSIDLEETAESSTTEEMDF